MSTTIQTPKLAPYLTWIGNRTPHQKPHYGRGQAQKAVLFRMRGDKLSEQVRVYEWKANGWELLWDIPEGTPRSELPWL